MGASAVALVIAVVLFVALVLVWVRLSKLKRRARESQEQYARLTDMYRQLEAQVPHRAMEIYEKWKQKELDSLKATYEKMAQDRGKNLFEEWKQKAEKEIREDAIKKSRSVILGKVTEHLTPFLFDFPYNPKDARFIGTPVDIIVFNGMDTGEISEIVLVEVKTGKSQLTSREREIRNAVDAKNVRFEVFRLTDDGVEIKGN